MTKFHLKEANILNVPFQTYDEFSFIVNGKEFKTTRIIADLLSPKICQLHTFDPTINEFIINTNHTGDFTYVINLSNFQEAEIPENEIPFISEIFKQLGLIEVEIISQNNQSELTFDNIFDLIKLHETNQIIYSKMFQTEIDFISLHFFELVENHENQLIQLSFDTLERIINNPKLRLKDESQLLTFINNLYSSNSSYSIFYNYVRFLYVEATKIETFIEIFDINDISNEIWQALSFRMMHQVSFNEEYESYNKDERYTNINFLNPNSKEFKFESNEKFNGIINYLRSNSDDNVENKINITASTINDSSQAPINSILFEKKNNYFASKDENNSWICYDFKDHQIIPTDYTIRSPNFNKNSQHPKSWVLEGTSKDSDEWEILDSQNDNEFQNGPSFVHTYHIEKPKIIRKIRIRETGKNWNRSDNYNLVISAFEIYGKLF